MTATMQASGQSQAAWIAHADEVRARLLAEARRAREAENRAAAARSSQLAELYEAGASEASGLGQAATAVAIRSLAGEAAALLRLAPSGMEQRMARAWQVASRFPATQRLWESGAISEQHAWAVSDHGIEIDDERLRAVYEAELLEVAPELTARELAALAERLAAQATSLSYEERYEEAKRGRGVRVVPELDGMAALRILMPGWQAAAIADRLTQEAKALREASELHEAAFPEAERNERTLDQIRADLAVDHLLGGAAQQLEQAIGRERAARITARVSIEVPMASLRGESRAPAMLDGQPLPITAAEELAQESARFVEVEIDPDSNLPAATRPRFADAELTQILRIRDQVCRFPGCRRRAERCDLDHTVAWADGGPTHPGNLAHLCRAHHVMKHQSAWAVRNLGGGVLEWTSPAGFVMTDHPARTGPWFMPEPGQTSDTGQPGMPASSPGTGRDAGSSDPPC